MIWSTPSSKYAQVVAKSEPAGGIGCRAPAAVAILDSDDDGMEGQRLDDGGRRSSKVASSQGRERPLPSV